MNCLPDELPESFPIMIDSPYPTIIGEGAPCTQILLGQIIAAPTIESALPLE